MFASALLLQNHCRTCLRKNENAVGKKGKTFISFDKKQDVIEILKKTLPQLSLTVDDQLPKIICEICFKKIKDINKFQSNAVRAERKLRSAIGVSRNKINCDPLNISHVDVESGDVNIWKPATNNLVVLEESDEVVEVFDDLDSLDVRPHKSQHTLSRHVRNKQIDQNLTEKVKTQRRNSQTKICDVEEIRIELIPALNTAEISTENNGIQNNSLATNTISNYIDDNVEIENDTTDKTICKAKHPESNREWESKGNSSESTNIKNDVQCENNANDKGICNAKKSQDNVERESISNSWESNNIEDEEHDVQIENITINISKPPKSNKDCEPLINSSERPKRTCSKRNVKPKVNEKKKVECNFLEGKLDTIETQGFPCKKCGCVLESSSSLKAHVMQHAESGEKFLSSERAHVCQYCGKHLKSKRNLRHHLLRHISEKKRKQHKCSYCNKEFKRSTNLREHEKIHTGERPFLCSTCGKSFSNSWSLKLHSERHSNDLKYECPLCPKRFRCLQSVSAHKAIVHSNDRPHICDKCGASFKKPYSLRSHQVTHGEKKHKCDFCEKKFAKLDQCRRHMRTHTGEKPYKCKYCDQAYAQSNDMVKHMRIHLGDSVYRCELCPQGFRLLCELRKHFATHKEDDEETKLKNLQALKDENERIQAKLKADLEMKKIK